MWPAAIVGNQGRRTYGTLETAFVDSTDNQYMSPLSPLLLSPLLSLPSTHLASQDKAKTGSTRLGGSSSFVTIW